LLLKYAGGDADILFQFKRSGAGFNEVLPVMPGQNIAVIHLSAKTGGRFKYLFPVEMGSI